VLVLPTHRKHEGVIRAGAADRRSHDGTIFARAADLYIGVVCVQRQTDECTLPLDQVRAIAVAASVPSYCLLVALTTSIILFTSLVYLIYLLANLESNALEKKAQAQYQNKLRFIIIYYNLYF